MLPNYLVADICLVSQPAHLKHWDLNEWRFRNDAKLRKAKGHWTKNLGGTGTKLPRLDKLSSWNTGDLVIIYNIVLINII